MSIRRWRYVPIVLLAGLIAADSDPAACPDCFHEGYQIDMSLVPLLTTPPASVLLSGYRDGRCQRDLICTASADVVWLGDLGKGTSYNWWNSCNDREMVVFAGGHAPTPLHPPGGNLTSFQPTLKDAAILKLAVWVEGADPTGGDDKAAQGRLVDAQDELGKTQQIFDGLGAGIKLDYTVKLMPWVLPEPVKGILDNATCDLAKTLMNGLTAGGDMAAMQDPARLNVYFIKSTYYFQDGLTCPGHKDQHPDTDRYVIFVANEHSPSTLAHEIGHALGLVLRATMPGGKTGQNEGDVNELDLDPYLPTDNLMYSGVGNVRQITVGEIYRMHFDKRSWLWRNVTATKDYPLACQASPVAGGPCPPLTLHPTRGWP